MQCLRNMYFISGISLEAECFSLHCVKEELGPWNTNLFNRFSPCTAHILAAKVTQMYTWLWMSTGDGSKAQGNSLLMMLEAMRSPERKFLTSVLGRMAAYSKLIATWVGGCFLNDVIWLIPIRYAFVRSNLTKWLKHTHEVHGLTWQM